VHVDFETQARIPKLSAKVYKEIVASNGSRIGSIAESIRV
jgi:beta-glucosidase/6-phospho-beta-glucosidase/beta-galactosidase